MAALIKGQLLKHLSKFTKNLSPDQINVSTLKGEGELSNLVLDDQVLTELMDLPTWLKLKRATCNKVALKYVDEIIIDMETCESPRQSSGSESASSFNSGGKYGFAERIIDGMFVSINSVTVNFRALKFHASIQLSRILIQSKTPTWQSGDLRLTRIKDDLCGEIILFKEAEWQTLRIEANALEGVDPNLATTPLRLIANQSKIRISLKKRITDCTMVASRLQVNLDDLLWVLTDSQLKAALVFINSLSDVVKRSNQLSKKQAAEKIKKQSKEGTPLNTATQPARPQPPQQRQQLPPPAGKTQAPMRQLFERYDIKETSYHLYTGRIDLHLCDDASPEDEESRRKVEGGAMQVTLFKLALDFYPYHSAGGPRTHWLRYDENMGARDAWAQELLNAFREDVRTARDFYTSPQPSPTRTYASQNHITSPNRQSPDKTSSQNASPSHQTPRKPQPTKLLESSVVMRLEDFALYRVSTASDQQRSTPKKFLSSDKKQLLLPPEMSSVHMEYTDYYFPEGIDFPVPHPNLYIVINPVRLMLDYLTIVWLNAFALNLYQKAEVPVSEGPKIHTDIKLNALMPRVILPSDEEKSGQSDRPDGLQLQISRATLTNCRLEHRTSNQELQKTLDEFSKTKLFHGAPEFPHADMDFTCVPDIFQGHVDKSNGQYLDKSIESVLVYGKLPADMCNVPNGDVKGLTKSNSTDSSLGLTYYNMRADSFKLDATKDVWCLVLDQIWAEFIGVLSSKNRPVPFIESFPVTVWMSKHASSEEPQDEGVESKCVSQSDWGSSSDVSQSSGGHSASEENIKKDKNEPSPEFPPVFEALPKTTPIPPAETKPRQKLADTHLLVTINTKINIQINHYQYLFLLRLLETVSKYQAEMEEDAVFLTKAPLPLSNTVAAVLLSEIQLALICPPLPELPQQEDDSEGIKDEAFSSNEAVNEDLTDAEEVPAPRTVRAGSLQCDPQRDTLATDNSSSSSSLPDLTNPSLPIAVGDGHIKLSSSPIIAIQDTEGASERLLSSSDSSARHSLEASDSSSHQLSSSYRKQGSGEVKKSLAAGLSSISKGFGTSYNKLTERMKQNMGKSGLLDVDDGEDWETLSVKSSASSDEDELMMMKLQTGPELPAFEHKYNLDDSQELVLDEKEVEVTSPLTGRRPLGVVSVVCFRLVNVAASAQMLGKDLALAAQVDHLVPVEHGNINLETFQASYSAPCDNSDVTEHLSIFDVIAMTDRTASHENDLDLETLPEAPISLRYQTGPSAGTLAPTAADLGHLRLHVNRLQLCLLQSSLSNLVDLIEDEKIPAAMPMKLLVNDTNITLKNDKLPTHVTSPGSVPTDVCVNQVFIERGTDGVFHISAPSPSDQLSMSSQRSATPPKSPPGVLSPSPEEQDTEELPHEIILRELQQSRQPSAPRSNEALEQENDMLRRHLEKIGKMSTATGGFNVEKLQTECERWKKEAQGLQRENETMMTELAERSDEVTKLEQERDSLLATLQLLQEELSKSERMRSSGGKHCS